MIKSIIPIIISILLFSCYSVKHIPANEYLLTKNKVIINKQNHKTINNIFQQDISSIIKQTPNKKLLQMIPFHVWVYNLSNPNKDNWINNYLRRIGEAPIILDQELTDKSVVQIKTYCENNGFFQAKVNSYINYQNHKAHVEYHVQPGQSYLINDIKYNSDSNADIHQIIKKSINKSEIEKGDIFTSEALNNERVRITKLLKNNGYFRFSKDLIYVEADSSKEQLIDIKFEFENLNDDSITYQKFNINKIFINIGEQAENGLKDTVLYNGYYFINSKHERTLSLNYIDNIWFKLNIISELIEIKNNTQYSEKATQKTYQNLSNLQFFKKIKITFHESGKKNEVNCKINLQNPTKMYYSIDGEIKKGRTEDYGLSIYGQFGNNNLFNGAENLNLKVSYSLGQQIISGFEDSKIEEWSASLGIRKPKLIVPRYFNKWLANSFQMNTNFVFSWTSRIEPAFNREIITQRFGYNWKNSLYNQHQLNIIELSYSDIDKKQGLQDLIAQNPFINLGGQFDNKFIPSINYIFTFNNQKLYQLANHTYFKAKLETSGNLFQLLGQTGQLNQNPDKTYILFNRIFSQYAKFDMDIRRYLMLTKNNTLALRSFLGIGYPYGNSTALPIEKRFFAGGANSIRAWEAFELGPGSFAQSTDSINYSTGDLKLEFNIEYRFKLFNTKSYALNSAIFVDGGNIWSIKENELEGSLFSLNSFVPEIALGGGIGFRLDFDYFIIRLDIASILRDPSQPTGEQWVKNPFNGKIRYNLAIGYPF